MSRHLLGVQIIDAGCRSARIEPHLGDLQWVESTFPTPYGLIHVRHDKRPDGTIKSKIDAPDGVRVER